ncbi:MAG: DUF3108 domain-containing protein [Nitrospiraceae bacterium]
MIRPLRRNLSYLIAAVSFICFIGFILADAAVSSSSPAPLPFSIGERFTYKLSWLNMTAGTAVMEVGEAPMLDGHQTFRLLTTARSGSVVTKFYPVDNRVESVMDSVTLLPQQMVFRRREGKRKNDFNYTFQHADGKVTAVKDGVTETLTIPPGTQDTISCLYYVRHRLPVIPGASLIMNVHHDKKNYKLEVRVEAHETLDGPWGRVNTIRALAIMPFQGIFLNEGNIRVWFTNDDRRIPVKMKAKVIIGSVIAELVDGFRASAAH